MDFPTPVLPLGLNSEVTALRGLVGILIVPLDYRQAKLGKKPGKASHRNDLGTEHEGYPAGKELS